MLVEDGYAARVMAAYIDLNPVRAGMVARPEDYRWCSYGEAMRPGPSSGRAKARGGICRVLAKREEAQNANRGGAVSWDGGAAERYRMMLFADGEEVFVEDIHSGVPPGERELKRVRKGFRREDVEKVLARGGKLGLGEALRCRVRYFTDGMVVGSREFVDQVFKQSRERFGKKRKTGARPMRNVGWKKGAAQIYSMRQLMVRAIE